MDNLIICPICKSLLNRQANVYNCINAHSYDISKGGYCNLMLASNKKSKNPGDNIFMVNARLQFLSGGYYNILKDRLIEIINGLNAENLLDCGCGEGYFCEGIAKALPKLNVYAFDISKVAIKKACTKNKSINFFVASTYNIPIKDNSIDVLIKNFAPKSQAEFNRVLKDDGVFIEIVPDKRHLYELKQVLYENVYENEVKTEYDNFELISSESLTSMIDIESNSDILNLFTMTPYYYRTSEKMISKLQNLDKLRVQIAFKVNIFKKISKENEIGNQKP